MPISLCNSCVFKADCSGRPASASGFCRRRQHPRRARFAKRRQSRRLRARTMAGRFAPRGAWRSKASAGRPDRAKIGPFWPVVCVLSETKTCRFLADHRSGRAITCHSPCACFHCDLFLRLIDVIGRYFQGDNTLLTSREHLFCSSLFRKRYRRYRRQPGYRHIGARQLASPGASGSG